MSSCVLVAPARDAGERRAVALQPFQSSRSCTSNARVAVEATARCSKTLIIIPAYQHT